MSFHLPSAASRGIVSILNDRHDDEKINKHTINSPAVTGLTTCESPTPQSPSICPSAMPALKPNDPSANSYSSVSSSATQQSSAESYASSSRDRSGNSTDRTSVEPSPQPSVNKRLQEEGKGHNPPQYHRQHHDHVELQQPRPHLRPAPSSPTHSQSSWTEAGNADYAYDRMSISTDYSGLQRSTSSSPFLMKSHHQGQGGGSESTVAGKRRYPCTHFGCDKTFSTSGHAARHNRIHTGQKPYRCTFPGCKATFSRQDNALAHFRTGHALAKQRSGLSTTTNTINGEGAAAFPSETDMASPVGPLDADHLASVQLGRKALEEGTAIAVVREGRVERTVGLPNGKRPTGSNGQARTRKPSEGADRHDYGSQSDSYSQAGHSYMSHTTPAAEYAQSRSVVAGFADGDARQRAAPHQVEFPRSFRNPASISSSSSSSASARVHPYYPLASKARLGSFSSLQEFKTNERARSHATSSESGPGSKHYPLPSPSSPSQGYPSYLLAEGVGVKRSGSHSLHTMSAPFASSIGFRRGSATGSSLAAAPAAHPPPHLPQPFSSASHRGPASTSGASSASVSPSIMGQWSSMRLDGLASNVRAHRSAGAAWNTSVGQQQLRSKAAPSSSALSVSPIPDTVTGASAVGGAGRSVSSTPSSRPNSFSSSAFQSPDCSPEATSKSNHDVEDRKQATTTTTTTTASACSFRLPISSDRFAAGGDRGGAAASLARGSILAEGLTLPPLRLPA